MSLKSALAGVASAWSSMFALPFKGLLSNSALYGLAYILPAVLGLAAVPIILNELGKEALGFLTLFWIFLTFLANFDFGVGSALAKRLAEGHEDKLTTQEGELVVTALMVQMGIGCILAIGAGGILFGQHWVGSEVETHIDTSAIVLLLVCLPFLALMNCCRAIFEAKLQFKFMSLISLLTGVSQFLVPLIVLQFNAEVFWIIVYTLLGRFLILAMMGAKIGGLFEHKPHWPQDLKSRMSDLWQIGSWIALANLVAPALHYTDKMILPLRFDLGSVAYYTIPFDFMMRLLVLPTIIVRIMFPYLSKAAANNDDHTPRMFQSAANLMTLFGIALLGLAIFMPALLEAWLGSDFGQDSGLISRILLSSFAFSGLTFLANYTMIARNRPDAFVKVMASTGIVYLFAAIAAFVFGSVVWVVVVWSVRIVCEAFIISVWVSSHFGQQAVIKTLVRLAILFVLAVGVLALPS